MNTEIGDTSYADLGTPGLEPGQGETRRPATAMTSEIEQVIERIGARYVADLRALSDEFNRFYSAELDAKNRQIVEINQAHRAQLAARDEQIAELVQRVKAAEDGRDVLEARARQFTHASTRYVADLRALSEDLGRRVEAAERQGLEAHTPEGQP